MIYDIIKSVFKVFYNPVKYEIFKVRWKKANRHNYTYPVKTIFPLNKVSVGNYTYGPLEIYSWNNENEKIEIGSFCSIASDVKFLMGGNHDLYNISTFPFRFYFQNKDEATTKGPIIIEDDVWIGMNSIILSGIRLSQGCVVAAGSVIAKSFPPYSIIGGNPAKILKKRFDDNTIQELLKIDFNKLNKEIITQNVDKIYDPNNFYDVLKQIQK
ncbi:CatB-related O-acetyltransferase [Epilithonimonas pallida]|uniref:Hexapeptide repeat of succinyl-transferase n=1 Tax=Epilithonimonas pallida TaxID=373671 RepID=A0ABY1R684_9FLAO|nr:CatB-related O-acetyltransferase [Epilithonimonas pallida]SMP94824.1 Hexapeptide repeat of succinyl-transferase [Epilithonimonas pallida]